MVRLSLQNQEKQGTRNIISTSRTKKSRNQNLGKLGVVLAANRPARALPCHQQGTSDADRVLFHNVNVAPAPTTCRSLRASLVPDLHGTTNNHRRDHKVR